jgi:hypothetical protein
MYRFLWIFVEGSDDRRFVDRVLRPILEKKYDYLDTWEYAQEPDEKTMEFLRSIRSMKADYLFLADIDNSPCVTTRKEILAHKYNEALEPTNAVIVAREIESWYMAGMDEAACRELRIKGPLCTDHMTKEQFRSLMPGRFNDSVVDFMTDILRGFRIEVAKGRNRSFCYLMDLLEARSEKA